MGTGFERELPRPLVLRHAYQSETRRYTPRCPERTLLYRIMAKNLETVLQTAREQTESGLGLPKYVEKELREYLRCAVPCYGFTRLVCEACGRTLFLSFSCKRRGSVGIGKVVELDEAGDVQYSQEQADEKRFALRKSPHAGEFGGFGIHAGVTVHAADKDCRERLIRYCARPALSMERMSETSNGPLPTACVTRRKEEPHIE